MSEEELSLELLHLQARIDALTHLLEAVNLRAGYTQKSLDAALSSLEATCLQKRLEALENNDPALAAKLDTRPLSEGIDGELSDLLELDS